MNLVELKMNELNGRVNNVLNYIKDNPNSDPNAYEMNDIMFKVSGLLNEERESGLERTSQSKILDMNFQKMMYLRLPQLIKNLNARFLEEYFKLQMANMSVGANLGDEDMREYFNSVCGVNLYIHQRLRDLAVEEPIYTNKEEHSKIFKMREMFDDYGISNDMTEEIDFAFNATPSVYNYRKENFYKTR